jgi:glycosyltransferase involved in cell wall biosynthesis
VKMQEMRILIDGREFAAGKTTGISRFLEGLIDALSAIEDIEIVVAVTSAEALPASLKKRDRVVTEALPAGFFRSERILSRLTQNAFSLFISPYPKLPLPGSYCQSIHTVHDVHDLTHSAYRNRWRCFFDAYRLKSALETARLTWYDSAWSLEETRKLVGKTGRKPVVRFPAVGEQFYAAEGAGQEAAAEILHALNVKPGSILVTGNGMPHKNLGVLLSISSTLSRELLFVGVSEHYRHYWMRRYPHARARWLGHLHDDALPSFVKTAFCLALPSTAEGFGYPALEAMACGIPAVVSRIPVLMETTGGNAIAPDPGDPEQWLDAFNRLEDRALYAGQREKGLAWTEPLRGRRGWQNHLDDVLNLIGRGRS